MPIVTYNDVGEMRTIVERVYMTLEGRYSYLNNVIDSLQRNYWRARQACNTIHVDDVILHIPSDDVYTRMARVSECDDTGVYTDEGRVSYRDVLAIVVSGEW